MNVFSFLRFLLYPFALLYGAIVWLRNRLYDTKVFASVSFSIPVINVGNLSVGGTGKTPHVEYLIRLLQYRYKVATMSRGYKRQTQGFLLAGPDTNALQIGDEPMQYHMKFPELVVCVAEERLTGIPTLLHRRPDVEVILLDDAYQHRSVKPGLNILVTDYSRPFYNDYILPYGMLREGRSAYHRAHMIVVSKCPLSLTEAQAQSMVQKIHPLPGQQVFFTGLEYGGPYDFFTTEPAILQGKNVLLVCCIARPEPLQAYLQSQAMAVHPLTYADHHYFLTKDLEEIRDTYNNWNVGDKVIVTTEKDATRLQLLAEKIREWGIAILVLPVAVTVLLGRGGDFDQAVFGYIEGEMGGGSAIDSA
jgi:tetraacyldisaccharide 4'-kinase